MALTSMTCVESLSFRFSLHHLEDKYISRPSFYYSWSEPFDLDYAGKTREGNPKRCRSQPATLLAPTNAFSYSNKRRDHKTQSLDIFRGFNSQNRTPTEVCVSTCTQDFHSGSDSAKHQLAGCKYVNEKTSKTSDEEDDLTSDEELAELCCVSPAKKDVLPREPRFLERKNIARKENIEEKTKTRKRTLDHSHELTNENIIKRARPRLDFEKMRLSRRKTLKKSCSTNILFDETFFKPIFTRENNQ